jgi:inorganic triphosphatase YgiF
MIRGFNVKQHIMVHLGAGLIYFDTVDQNLSGHDHGLGPFP